MRGQWTTYDNFNLLELIDELKTRRLEPIRVDDILHGAIIIGKDYNSIKKELIHFLNEDDKKDKNYGFED